MRSTEVVTSNAIVPELLSYENYEQWSLRVKTYLMVEDLWDEVVNPNTVSSSPQPEEGEKFKDWTRMNVKALYVIQNCCGTDVFSAIISTETAKDAWVALEAVCKAKQKAKRDVEEFEQYKPFFDYVKFDQWEKAEKSLIELPDAVRIRDPRSENGETALYIAAWGGHLQIVKGLMRFMTQEDLEMKTIKNGSTPLHAAVMGGHLDIVKLLAPKMGQVKDSLGNTSFHIAALCGHVHIVKGLLSFMTEEDIRMKDNYGYTALHLATMFGNLDIVKELVSLMGEITDNDGNTALHDAVNKGNACIVKELVNLMRKDDCEIRNKNGYTALDLAVMKEDVPILRELVSYDDCDRYISFIDYVIKGDWVDANECLGKLGPYAYDAIKAIDPRDGSRNTSLHIAVKQGHVDIVKELVSLMTQEMLEEKEADGLCERPIIERAKKIIQQQERRLSRVLEQRNAFGDTALHLAIRKENVLIVKELVICMRKEGFELKNNHGSTALHETVSKESVHIVKELVSFMRQESFEVKNEEGYTSLHQAVINGNVEIVKELVRVMRQEGLEVEDTKGFTALHLASKAKNIQISIVKELVSAMRPEALELKDRLDNSTALACAMNMRQKDENLKEMVKHIAEKNPDVFLHRILDQYNHADLPVTWAFTWDKNELGRHLYTVTPHEALRGNDGAFLIAICIACMNNLDIALHLLQLYPNLIFAGDESYNLMLELAQMRSAFYSGTTLTLAQKLIYNSISIQPPVVLNIHDISIDISEDTGDDQGKRNAIFSGINRIYRMKSIHLQVYKLLECMANTIKTAGELSKEKLSFVERSTFKATESGNVEFVKHLLEALPELEEIQDEEERSIFHFAVQCRQENIYNLFHGLNKEKRYKTVRKVDKKSHNIIHAAGNLSPVARLNHIQGASLQMQRELHWFKEVESIAPLHYREFRIFDGEVEGLTPNELFTKNHKDLMEEAEKSIKDTASSCTVVGSLIATMMFAAAFTVPGGNNDDTGIPMFVDSDLFLAFMVSDTLSLVSSTTCVIIFLGLLTSRFAEKDYLVSLPKKMMLGLCTLFLSVASMMIAFSCALIIMLHGNYSWIVAPTIVLGSVPIAAFVWMQFPLLVNTFISTYGPGIFKRETQPWYKSLMLPGVPPSFWYKQAQ